MTNRPQATSNNRFIPSIYCRITARELGLQEKELPLLLKGTGLSQDIFLPSDESQLTGQQQLRILDNAQQIAEAPEIGLRLGGQFQPSVHGPLGYLALSSPDLITALELLCDFLPIRLPLFHMRLRSNQDWLQCSLTITIKANKHEHRIFNECFAMLIQSVSESLVGRKITEAKIELTHEKPSYHHLYKDYLHSTVEFGQAVNVFRFPAILAHQTNVSGNSGSYAMAQKLCHEMLDQAPKSVLSTERQVRHLLLSKTPSAANETDIAQAMFISKRTLARRLDKEGTSYRAIREQLVSELAYRHLRESTLTVESIATLLGYNDASAFRKAFHRWYGMAPSMVRA